jgi:DNA-binding NarL/FixJ family response regulator
VVVLRTIRIIIVMEAGSGCARELLETLRRCEDIEIVGTADSTVEGLSLVRGARPHVVVLGVDRDVESTTGFLQQARAAVPAARMIVIGIDESPNNLRAALGAGAAAYLSRARALTQSDVVVRAVHAGGTWLPDPAASVVLDARSDSTAPSSEKFTPRELQILVSIGEGFSTKEIAASLGISGRTVDAHRASIMKKLHLHNSHALRRYAIQVARRPK